jgi:hypothetical protein
MRRVAFIVALFGCCAVCALGQGKNTPGCAVKQEFSPIVVSNPLHRVTFQCDLATPLDLIRAVGRQTRIPIGIVLGQDLTALSRTSRSYDLENVNARFALLEAIAGTGYSLREENHVMVLTASDVTIRQERLLMHEYSGFAAGTSSTMVELGASLTMWMRAAIDPGIGFGSSILSSTNDERFTVDTVPSATTEELANRIVSLGSKGMWIFRVDPVSPEGPLEDEVQIEAYQHYTNGAVTGQ